MKRVVLYDKKGNNMEAFMPEEEKDLREQVAADRRQNFKEHLYIGYLIVGTIAFTLGILISLKRLNGN